MLLYAVVPNAFFSMEIRLLFNMDYYDHTKF